MDENLDAYLMLTEDAVTMMIRHVAWKWPETSASNKLAKALLTRNMWRFLTIRPGKRVVLEQALDGVEDLDDAFQILECKSTVYKDGSAESVFVEGDEPEDITRSSTTISMLGDRAQADYILVVMRPEKHDAIREVAEKAGCIVGSRKQSGQDGAGVSPLISGPKSTRPNKPPAVAG